MTGFFEDFEEERPEVSNIKPLHAIPKTEKDLLKWLQTVIETLQKQGIQRSAIQRQNLAVYRGAQLTGKKSNNRTSDRAYKTTKIEKFIVNHLYDMTETKISQMSRLKPAVEILPTNDEFEDKNAAKAVKSLINHLWYINSIDDLTQNLQRHCRIFGEGFCFIEWDSEAGDLHPMYVEARDAGEDLFLIDEEGNETSVKIDEPVFIGDVKYTLEVPWRVFLQRQAKMKDVEYCFKIDLKHVDDMKKKYPSKAKQINSNEDTKAFDPDSLQDRMLEDEVIVYEFWHKHTEFMPQGAYFKFTKDVILEKGPLPYSHGKLPFIRLTDMDIPDKLNGVSRYEMVKPIQNMHNNLSTLLAKNIYLTGHAKWVMPRGACKIDQLGNDNTIVQFQGPMAPQLLQVRPNPPEAYNFRDALRDEMGQIYGVYGTSRGQPPKGITAGVALQFLNEQENERATTDVSKHNNMIADLARMSIAVCGDYYADDDGRMLRIVGKDNKYSIEYFDKANLNKDYDIRIQNSSALPESKAGKVQRLLEIMQYQPELVSKERWLDLLEFGNTEKLQTIVTEAIRSAESETEDILAGKPAGIPEKWEDHIQHWQIHTRALQNRAFKEKTPPEIQAAMIEHIRITEYAMVQRMQETPLFEAQVARLPSFPIFYSPETPARSAEHQTAMVQGASNRGDSVEGMIPASSPGAFPGEAKRDIINNGGKK